MAATINNELAGKISNQDIINMIQGRLNSLAGKKSGYIKSLPENVQKRINGLKGIQIRQAELEAQFNKEIYELEVKYAALYKPYFDERSQVVNGLSEPKEEDVEVGKALTEEEEGEEETGPEEVTSEFSTTNGIPEFWLTILKNHPELSETISIEDEKVLRHLINIDYRHFENELGYSIDFTFSPNDFFTNQILSKQYYFTLSSDFGELVLDHCEGTVIDWKVGKNVTVCVEEKKQVNKVTQETRVVSKETAVDSFFKIFSSIEIPDTDELTIEEETAIKSAMEADYELGEEFKISIIPHAVDWFTGKALEMDGEDYSDFFENDGEEEDEEEEEDDD